MGRRLVRLFGLATCLAFMILLVTPLGVRSPQISTTDAKLLPSATLQSGYTLTRIAGSTEIKDITCPSSTHCIAVGTGASSAIVATTANSAHTWRRAQINGSVLALESVMCTTNNYCLTVGWSRELSAVVLYSRDGGQRWEDAKLPRKVAELDSVACESLTVCMATGGLDNGATTILRSSDAGRQWSEAGLRGAGQLLLVSMACPLALDCLAVGTGIGFIGVVAHSANGGSSWVATSYGRSKPTFQAVGCDGPASCIVAGQLKPSALAKPIGFLGISSDEGRDWSFRPSPVPGATDLSAVACQDGGCVVVGSTGVVTWAMETSDGGTKWMQDPWRLTDTSSITASGIAFSGFGHYLVCGTLGGRAGFVLRTDSSARI
jgi:photosystem II stability/assembly factor-like uncharacterized protein